MPQHSAGVGQLGAVQVDLVVRHHPDELKDLLPAGDKAWAQHVVHAEGLGGRGGRRSRVVRGIRELLAQLQVVQNEPVAVVGNAQAVRGLAIGGGGKVGADPGGQPCASVRALGQQRPVQRAQRGVNPVSRGSGPGPSRGNCRPGGSCRRRLFKALVEHFIPRLQVVDEKEAVGFPRRLFIQLVELLLWQQGAQLLHHGVQLVLVAQPPAAEELHVHPHRCADEPQLLRAHPGAYLHLPAPDEESAQGAVRLVQLRRVSKVVDDYKHLVQFLHFQLLGRLRDLALLLDDAPQRRLVPLVPIPLCVHPQVPLNVLLDGDPAVVYVHTRAEDVNSLKDAAILLQNQADQSHGFARF